MDIAVTTVALCALISFSATPASAEQPESVVVSAVVFEGLVDTRREVVDRVVDIDAGERLSRATIEARVARLLDTGLFGAADWELVDESIGAPADDVRVLRITVRELVSVRPVFGFDRGGGRSRLLVGVRETNALGRGIELGTRVEQLDDAPSVEATMFAPWLADGSVYADLEVGYHPRSPEAGSFVRTRRLGAAEVGAHVGPRLRTGLSVAGQFDRYDTPALPTTNRVVVGLAGHLEAVRREGFVLRGVGASAEAASAVVGAPRESLDVAARGFLPLPWQSNFGARLRLGMASASHLGDDYYVGGLDEFRVGADGRYHGPSYWVANAELRVPSLATSWLALQHVAFVDAGAAAEGPSGWVELDEVDAGIGLRLISPALGHLTFRVDLAWSVVESGTPQLSFGTGQFF